jgi:hypothetical protein
VPSPIPDWPRLHWQENAGPRVSWTAALEKSGIDYRGMELPNCRWRIGNTIETRFDFVDDQEPMIDRMVETILKVEANIDALRDHDRKQGRADTTQS